MKRNTRKTLSCLPPPFRPAIEAGSRIPQAPPGRTFVRFSHRGSQPLAWTELELIRPVCNSSFTVSCTLPSAFHQFQCPPAVHVFLTSSQWKPQPRQRSASSASMHSAGRVSTGAAGHCAGQSAITSSTVAAMPTSARKSPHLRCIGSKTVAQSAVHAVGIPPGGQTTPSEQHTVVTMSANTLKSGNVVHVCGKSRAGSRAGGAGGGDGGGAVAADCISHTMRA
jgi:hypothetical protein